MQLGTTQGTHGGSTEQGLGMCRDQNLALKTVCLALEGSGSWV